MHTAITSAASTPPATPAPAAGTAPAAHPRAGEGVQGVIGDLIRGSAAGYEQATKLTAVQADKAAIHPFETVSTATALLKSKTAGIKGVGRATGLLHTIGGFALLIMTANASGTLRSPGRTAVELGNKVADLIDGKDTSKGFSMGWLTPPPQDGDAEPIVESSVGSALSSMGMR